MGSTSSKQFSSKVMPSNNLRDNKSSRSDGSVSSKQGSVSVASHKMKDALMTLKREETQRRLMDFMNSSGNIAHYTVLLKVR